MLKITEKFILVPWGTISAKTWGDDTNPPVLMVHGRQDNAGSFDLLLPKLSREYYYICIDLPGHGKSSHIPSNVHIDLITFVISIKYVIEYFDWKKIIIIAHSLGARIIHTYCMIYPEKVEKLVTLDAVTLHPLYPADFGHAFRNNLITLTKIFEKTKNNKPPEYTYEQALSLVQERRPTVICKEGAINMLTRALIPTENGKFLLSMDQRLKCIFYPPLSAYNIASIIKHSALKFPHLMLIASETNNLKLFETLEPILKEIKKKKNSKIIIVKGNHDVHNNNPDIVASYINRFLEKKYFISKV